MDLGRQGNGMRRVLAQVNGHVLTHGLGTYLLGRRVLSESYEMIEGMGHRYGASLVAQTMKHLSAM